MVSAASEYALEEVPDLVEDVVRRWWRGRRRLDCRRGSSRGFTAVVGGVAEGSGDLSVDFAGGCLGYRRSWR